MPYSGIIQCLYLVKHDLHVLNSHKLHILYSLPRSLISNLEDKNIWDFISEFTRYSWIPDYMGCLVLSLQLVFLMGIPKLNFWVQIWSYPSASVYSYGLPFISLTQRFLFLAIKLLCIFLKNFQFIIVLDLEKIVKIVESSYIPNSPSPKC